MSLAVKNYCGSAILRLIDAGRRVSHDRAASGCLPERLSRVCVHGHDKTFAAARVFLDEFYVVLLVAENAFVLINNRRNPAAVLADERPEIALPTELAVVI